MAPRTARARFYEFPYSREVFDGQIERLTEMPAGQRGEIHIDFHGLHALGAGTIHVEQGRPWEVLRAEMVPLRLRFHRASWATRSGVFADLDSLPSDHPARRLFDIVHMRLPGHGTRYWLFTDSSGPGNELAVRADACTLEERVGERRQIEVKRRWSWRPPNPSGPIPRPATLHRRYGGDPIAIHLGRRVYRQRLFIGGLRHQSEMRPLVDHVLNLCEAPNPWLATYGAHPADRHVCTGELAAGMAPEELLAEATWVAERLRAGERVLVHCAAGVNRSSTVCCATLMLLEGLTADEALARVRERHPVATPDPYHWFLLRWLAQGRETVRESSRDDQGPQGYLLRGMAAIG